METNLSKVLPVSVFSLVSLFVTFGFIYGFWTRSKSAYPNPFEFGDAWQFAISKRALLGAGLMPFICMVLFYGFSAHIYLTLGRWPHFGESLAGEVLQLHFAAAQYCVLGLFFSLYATGVMTLIGFAFKSFRWLSFSCLIHMVFAGLSFGSLFLAPHKFLNWLFD